MSSYKGLVDELIDYLNSGHMSDDVSIYEGGKVYTTWTTNPGEYKPYRDGWYVSKANNIDPRDYVKYDNPDTISVHFEGRLYTELNYPEHGYDVADELQDMFKKHGLYYELGYAWSLSGYED